MDLNYLLNREQHSLYMAKNSPSASARHAHLAFAKAYGVLIEATPFPHREFVEHSGWLPRDSGNGEGACSVYDSKTGGWRLKMGSELLIEAGVQPDRIQPKAGDAS
ncbi:hypothetical protein [Sphingomonas sp. Leaf231]|uniref:hypothetical protein n=1 Tax=Sphingomonas sp. Leaf231 TaxID=1736301 RepID=UPI000A53BE81|nr:hypothetical protein [Sphingomonas sp. Leaf231]